MIDSQQILEEYVSKIYKTLADQSRATYLASKLLKKTDKMVEARGN